MAKKKSWHPTKLDLDVIKRMASAGMTHKMVSLAVGISPATFQRSKTACTAFNQSQTEIITQIAESAIQKALRSDSDTAMIAFILKTRGGWRENKSYICLDDFDGEYQDKVKAIDNAFKDGKLAIEEYKILSDTLNDRLRNETMVDQIKKRLDELEKNAGFIKNLKKGNNYDNE